MAVRGMYISINHTRNFDRAVSISKCMLISDTRMRLKLGTNIIELDMSNVKDGIVYSNDNTDAWNDLYLLRLWFSPEQLSGDYKINIDVGNPPSFERGAKMNGNWGASSKDYPYVWWYDPDTETDAVDDATHTLVFPGAESLDDMKARLGAKLKRAAETYSRVSPIMHSFVHDSTKSENRCADVTDRDARDKLDIATNVFTQLYGYAWRELENIAAEKDSSETRDSIETLIDEIAGFDEDAILSFSGSFDKDRWERSLKTDKQIHIPDTAHASKRVVYDIKENNTRDDVVDDAKVAAEYHELSTQGYADARLNPYKELITSRTVTLPSE